MAKKEEEQSQDISANDIALKFLKANQADHLNFVEEKYYRISTGSWLWDFHTNGGLPPGLHRFIGPPESGKTSSCLEVMRNFLKRKNSYGIYIKAEGRLSKEMQQRCGLKFIFNPEEEEWKAGSILVIESNIFEFCINFIRELIDNNPNGAEYCVLIDSMDGLILRDDAAKSFDENSKVAGSPLLTKKFLQKMANKMAKLGHLVLMTGQYSTNISLDTYAKASDKRPSQGGGGWGAAHFANFVFDFSETFNGDVIKERDKEPESLTNPRLGKKITVKILKSPNEKTGTKLSYPVKIGVVGGSSVWRSYEIFDVLQMFKLITGSTWLTLSDTSMYEGLRKAGAQVPENEKWNGGKKFLSWLEEHKAAQEYFNDRLIGVINPKGGS